MIKKEDKPKGETLEKLIKDNFCSKLPSSIIRCSYEKESWCPKSCRYCIEKNKGQYKT
jgi:hypothetical protein